VEKRPPIIFVHGAFSRASHCDALAACFRSAGFDCHVPSLPGHDPSDPALLSRLSLADYQVALNRVQLALPTAPILIGHSMGGLLAQHLAAAGPCAALVCVASAPPGMLPAQFRAWPYLAPLLPRILAGRAIHPSEATFRYLALHDLPPEEQDHVASSLGSESGRAYRAMILGTSRVRASDVRCPVLCVSGGKDRIVSQRVARRIAAHYRADHRVLPDRGHWLLARAGIERVAQTVLEWLDGRLRRPARTAQPEHG
jgi:pimeloyl-ACP methyl ester carboxylesterase